LSRAETEGRPLIVYVALFITPGRDGISYEQIL